MNEANIEKLVTVFGPVAALLAVGIYALVKGWVVPKLTLDKLEAGFEIERGLYKTMLTGKDTIIAEKDKELHKWQELCLRTTDLAEHAALTAEKAAEKLPMGTPSS